MAVAVTHLGRKSVTVEYAVRDVPSGTDLATGRTILVTYDYRTNQSIAMPETWRRTIEAFETPAS